MTAFDDLCYVRQDFRTGQLVKLKELEYLEIDPLYHKLRKTIGIINQVIPVYRKSNWWFREKIVGYRYEVIWIFPNKETSISHHPATKLVVTKNHLGISFKRWFKGKEKWGTI